MVRVDSREPVSGMAQPRSRHQGPPREVRRVRAVRWGGVRLRRDRRRRGALERRRPAPAHLRRQRCAERDPARRIAEPLDSEVELAALGGYAAGSAEQEYGYDGSQGKTSSSVRATYDRRPSEATAFLQQERTRRPREGDAPQERGRGNAPTRRLDRGRLAPPVRDDGRLKRVPCGRGGASREPTPDASKAAPAAFGNRAPSSCASADS